MGKTNLVHVDVVSLDEVLSDFRFVGLTLGLFGLLPEIDLIEKVFSKVNHSRSRQNLHEISQQPVCTDPNNFTYLLWIIPSTLPENSQVDLNLVV